MNDPEKEFLPILIDQQIEHPDAFLPRGEARLIQDLQTMYDQENSASIDDVWTRLAQHRISASQQPKLLSLQEQRHRSERISPMKQRDMNITPTQRRGLPRLFSLIAAVLVCIVLVGSMLLVFSTLKNKTPGSMVGGHTPTATGTSTATTTPALPPECDDIQDQANAMLCATHAETVLNITKTFGTHEVTFVRAYADPARLMLIYTTKDSPTSDVISFSSLTIQQGMTLGGGASHVYMNPETKQWYNVVEFNTQGVPAGTTTLHIQSIVDAFSGRPTSLKFTIPFHTNRKIVPVNQTATSNGMSLTLDHLTLVGSMTSICLKSLQPLSSNLDLSATISINGQQLIDVSGHPALAFQSGNDCGTNMLELSLKQSLVDRTGSWTIKVVANTITLPHQGTPLAIKTAGTWTFHFTVSK
jgi:hypothetical protein